MYKLLVADDESLIVRGVCRTLSRLGMFEIEWALNGKDAWEILERKQTDAMLLDINMPDIDGITLLKKLSEIGTGVETVIISGYEAFDYAQEALRYGALDYLLKPLTPKDVEAVGIKLYERLEARKKEEEVNRQLREFVMQQRGTIKQKVLSDILRGSVQPRQIEEMRKIYGIDLRGECFTVAVICIRRRDEAMGEMRFQMLLRMAEQQIAQQISDVPEADLFNMENARYVLLFSSASPFDSVRLSELLEQIASALEGLEGVDVYIGKGVEVRGLEHVRDSYHSADAALDYREMFKNDHVYDIVDFRKDPSILEVQSHLDTIDAKLRGMQYQEVQAEVAALFACLDASRTLTQAQRCFYLCKCSTLLMSIMLENGLAADGFIEELFFAGDKIPESPERLKRGILAALNVIREDMFRVYSEKNHGISLKAAEYIKEHYGDETLCVRKLSEILNYSANYLGNVFKREYGESINDFINRYRVKMAKKLMDETDMMVYEIAFAVGFSNQHYFSRTFKRITGLAPSEYRNHRQSAEISS